jgi:mRNA-degrading endonuclease RelE of RelBE toxin-antitoxin system
MAETARSKVVGDLGALEKRPLGSPPRVRRLRGFPFPLYRLRSGDYRVLYRIDAEVVTILRVIDRKDLDRVLRQAELSR